MACSDIRKNVFKSVAMPSLLYDSEAWVMNKRVKGRIRLQALETRFLSSVITADRIKSNDIRTS